MPGNLKFAPRTIMVGPNNRVFEQDYDGAAVTPADGSDLPGGACVALYITGAGNVNVQLVGGGTAVLTSLSAGQYVIAGVTRVLSTSTTATGIFALYKTQG